MDSSFRDLKEALRDSLVQKATMDLSATKLIKMKVREGCQTASCILRQIYNEEWQGGRSHSLSRMWGILMLSLRCKKKNLKSSNHIVEIVWWPQLGSVTVQHWMLSHSRNSASLCLFLFCFSVCISVWDAENQVSGTATTPSPLKTKRLLCCDFLLERIHC